MSIKVCHITSVHQRYDTRIFLKECTSLAEAGYEVTLLVADEKPKERLNDVDIIPVHGIPKSRISRILKSGSMMLNSALEINAEVYHLHDPELLRLAVKLKKTGKRVIFDSHEDYPEQIKAKTYIPFLLRNIISAIYKYYETRVVQKIDAVIIPCTTNEGINFFENRSHITAIISNTPILAEFYDRYDSTETPKDNRTLCLIGGLTYNRGLTHLIKAVYKARAKLILAGTFSPLSYREELEKMPEYECVDYRGVLGRKEVLQVYKESSMGVATSLYVGQYNMGDILATKVYECMSMGLPVIITRFPFVEKVNSKYKFAITVDPSNINAIAKAVRFLIDNPEKAKEMGENGRRAIVEEYNWGIEEQKLIALYEQVCSK